MQPKYKETPQGVFIRNPDTDSACWGLDKVLNGHRYKGSSKLYRRHYINDKDWYKANERWYAQQLDRITRTTVFGEPTRRTFMEATERYLEDHKGKLKDLKEFVRLASVANEHLGDVYLHELSAHHPSYQQLLRTLEARGVKNKTINNYIDPVSRITHYACSVRDSGGQPWLTSAPKFPQYSLEDQRKPRVITWSEQESLLRLLPEPLNYMSAFILHTGLRNTEVCNLLWRDQRSIGNLSLFVIQRAKNGLKLPVMLNSTAQQIINSCNPNSDRNENSHVFLQNDSPITRINGYEWKKWVRGVISRKRQGKWVQDEFPQGLGWDLTVHDLRHTFGHRLIEAGCPHEIRQMLLGHTNGNVTSHYSQASLETLQGWVEKIATPSEDVTPVLRIT